MNIENVADIPISSDFEQILGLYQKSGESGKQVFIAFDKADTYTPNTYKIVDKASVLRLSVGNELFGKSWSRQNAVPETEPISRADAEDKAKTEQRNDEE